MAFLLMNINNEEILCIYTGREWIENGIFYSEQITEFKNGEKQTTILSYSVG